MVACIEWIFSRHVQTVPCMELCWVASIQSEPCMLGNLGLYIVQNNAVLQSSLWKSKREIGGRLAVGSMTPRAIRRGPYPTHLITSFLDLYGFLLVLFHPKSRTMKTFKQHIFYFTLIWGLIWFWYHLLLAHFQVLETIF